MPSFQPYLMTLPTLTSITSVGGANSTEGGDSTIMVGSEFAGDGLSGCREKKHEAEGSTPLPRRMQRSCSKPMGVHLGMKRPGHPDSRARETRERPSVRQRAVRRYMSSRRGDQVGLTDIVHLVTYLLHFRFAYVYTTPSMLHTHIALVILKSSSHGPWGIIIFHCQGLISL
jgi:hypothetical protein